MKKFGCFLLDMVMYQVKHSTAQEAAHWMECRCAMFITIFTRMCGCARPWCVMARVCNHADFWNLGWMRLLVQVFKLLLGFACVVSMLFLCLHASVSSTINGCFHLQPHYVWKTFASGGVLTGISFFLNVSFSELMRSSMVISAPVIKLPIMHVRSWGAQDFFWMLP